MFEGRFQEALENIEKSLKCDPNWDIARRKLETVYQHLQELSEMVELRGKLKHRKLNGLLKVRSNLIIADQANFFF